MGSLFGENWLLVTWLILSAIPAALGYLKGRTWWKVYLLSVLASPLVGLLVVAFLKSVQYCPDCASKIPKKALVCSKCGKKLGGG